MKIQVIAAAMVAAIAFNAEPVAVALAPGAQPSGSAGATAVVEPAPAP